MTSKIRPIKSITYYFRAKPLRLVFAILWVIAIYRIIISGFVPDPYSLHSSVPLPHPYPSGFVTFLIIIMCVQAVLVWLLDDFIHSSFKLLPMLFVVIGGLFVGSIFAMHAPPPIGAFVIWQALSFVMLLLLGIWQAGLFLYNKSKMNK